MENYRDLIKLPIFQTNLQVLRGWCFWAAIISLGQSIFFGFITMYEILAYNCLFGYPNAPNNYKNLLKTICIELYYKGSCHGNKPPKINLDNIAVTMRPTGLLIMNSAYLFANICWMISSIILLMSLKNKRFSLNGKVIIPWLVITSMIWLYDLTFGFIIQYDLTTLLKQLYRLSITKNDELYKYTVTEIIMLLMLFKVFKGFILWILNAVAVLYITVHYIRCSRLDKKNIERINLFKMEKRSNKNNNNSSGNTVAENTGLAKPGGYINSGYVIEGSGIDTVANMIQMISSIDEVSRNRIYNARINLPNYENSNTYQNTEMLESPNTFYGNVTKAPSNVLNQCRKLSYDSMYNPATPSPDYTPPMERKLSVNSRFTSNPSSTSSF